MLFQASLLCDLGDRPVGSPLIVVIASIVLIIRGRFKCPTLIIETLFPQTRQHQGLGGLERQSLSLG